MLRKLHEKLEQYCCRHLMEPVNWRYRLVSKCEYFLRCIYYMNPWWYPNRVNHFPLLIKTEDGEVKVCERPEDLPTGRGFRVVATNREIVI